MAVTRPRAIGTEDNESAVNKRALLLGRRRSAGRRSRRREAQHWLKGVAGRHWCLARALATRP